MSSNGNVDIIIPVYNAFYDLQLCVQSIKKHTNLNVHRLIFVNDNSPDPQIEPYLDSLSSENIIVIHNEKNLGFSASINKGLSYSTNDVILLNTDTVVTKNWVEKLTRCAYSDPSIGTVTPLSNNATICSVPNFCEENIIPNDLSIDQYADLIEHCSFKRYPRITVAVGFCMFIKREVIDKTGVFDAETFGRGYGEENDFCNRAEQYGYHHVLCDDTYIYHSGTASFISEEKRKLIESHEKILMQRYPKQMQGNQHYVMTNPDQYLRENIKSYTDFTNNKKNVLYFLQADFREDASNHIGGTQFHVKDLVQGLKNDINIFVAARDREYLRVTAYTNETTSSFKFYIGNPNMYPVFFNKVLCHVINSILCAFSIDLVHVHHVQGLSLDIFYESKKMGIPLLATLHDFFFLCPNVKFLDDNNDLCIGGENCKRCNKCLNKQYDFSETVDILPNWRQENLQALSLCDVLITPSQNAKNIYMKYWPELGNRLMSIPHGLDPFIRKSFRDVGISTSVVVKYHLEHKLDDKENPFLLSGWAYIENVESVNSHIYVRVTDSKGIHEEYKAKKMERLDVCHDHLKYLYSGFSVFIPQDFFTDGDLKVDIIIENKEITGRATNPFTIKNHKFTRKKGFKVAFIGGMTVAKGSRFACEMIKKADTSIHWYIFGGIGDPDLFCLGKKNLTKTNWYIREELPKLLVQNKIDLVCILPIWPETFCYTISEAILGGVPVLVTDIGALGDRAREMDCGWVVPPNATSKQILDKILSIRENEVEYFEKKKRVESVKLRNVAEMCYDYKVLYQKEFRQHFSKNEYDRQLVYDSYVLANDYPVAAVNVEQHSNMLPRVRDLEMQLYAIQNSLAYKLVLKISQIRLPFKRQLKGVLLKIYKMLQNL